MEGRPFAASDARLAVPLIRWYPQQPQPEGYDRPQPPPVAVINQTDGPAVLAGDESGGPPFQDAVQPVDHGGRGRGGFAQRVAARPARPEIYLHDLQEPQSTMSVLVKTAGDPIAFAPILRSAIWDLDRDLATSATRTMDDIVDETFGLSRLTSSLAGTFALLALGLMLAGIYGLMAFTAPQRLPELGLRIALGAERRQVLAHRRSPGSGAGDHRRRSGPRRCRRARPRRANRKCSACPARSGHVDCRDGRAPRRDPDRVLVAGPPRRASGSGHRAAVAIELRAYERVYVPRPPREPGAGPANIDVPAPTSCMLLGTGGTA